MNEQNHKTHKLAGSGIDDLAAALYKEFSRTPDAADYATADFPMLSDYFQNNWRRVAQFVLGLVGDAAKPNPERDERLREEGMKSVLAIRCVGKQHHLKPQRNESAYGGAECGECCYEQGLKDAKPEHAAPTERLWEPIEGTNKIKLMDGTIVVLDPGTGQPKSWDAKPEAHPATQGIPAEPSILAKNLLKEIEELPESMKLSTIEQYLYIAETRGNDYRRGWSDCLEKLRDAKPEQGTVEKLEDRARTIFAACKAVLDFKAAKPIIIEALSSEPEQGRVELLESVLRILIDAAMDTVASGRVAAHLDAAVFEARAALVDESGKEI